MPFARSAKGPRRCRILPHLFKISSMKMSRRREGWLANGGWLARGLTTLARDGFICMAIRDEVHSAQPASQLSLMIGPCGGIVLIDERGVGH